MNAPTTAVTRRAMLVALAATPVLAGACAVARRPAPSTPVRMIGGRARRALPIPPLAQSRIAADGARVFELTAGAGTTEILAGHKTATWGFNGAILGPTLRARNGEKVRVRVRNTLDEVTTVHWHGMHLPARSDGGPHQPIAPGGTWTTEWTVKQEPATLWYHPHPHGATELHVYRGLSGMFFVDAAAAGAAGLPSEYGIDDVPVIIQDRSLTPAGQLDETTSADVGMTGPTIITNGIAGAYLHSGRSRIRLRILNGSSGRSYNLGLSGGRGFRLVGTDGGLLAAPAPMERILLSPGERAEIVVDLRPDETVQLRSYPLDRARRGRMDEEIARRFGFDDTLDVLALTTESVIASPELPDRFGAIAPLLPAGTEPRPQRTFDLQWHLINWEKMDMSRVDFTVAENSTEVWRVRNTDNWPHNFHVHDVQYQVLSLGGRTPPVELRGWKDTLFLAPGDDALIVMRFADYADPAAAYMYHCHMLAHEDQGMMGQFMVLAPGQTPRPLPAAHH